jgi:hypothetical protein
MAIITTGTVDNVKFGDDYGFFTLIDASSGLPEIFILWFGNLTSGGPVALYTSLLTIALTQQLTVEVSHESTSSFVGQILLRAQP